MFTQAVSLAALVAGVVAVPQLGSSKQQPLAGFVLGRSIGATWEAVNDPVMVRDTVCSCCQLPVLDLAKLAGRTLAWTNMLAGRREASARAVSRCRATKVSGKGR
eukprot:COSAG02_NODE_948_length_15709_cov_67.728700_2_plen_105_part_00